MATERFPARKSGTLVCGHPTACMYRWKDSNGVHKYCMACLFEKSNIKDLDTLTAEYKKSLKQPKEIVTPITPIESSKITNTPETSKPKKK